MRQRLQQVLFPQGISHRLKKLSKHKQCVYFSSILEGHFDDKTQLVALTGMRWNIIVPWLREMDDLRRSHLFPSVGW
jgi:hypothetical protein